MKQLLLLPLLAFGTMPAFAGGYQPGYSSQCFREVYREEYIPGTRDSPGRVRRWTEHKEVPCWNPAARPYYPAPPVLPAEPEAHSTNPDDNSCIEGSILGGIAGGALGGAAATQENWIWSIPTGVIGGALIGCQVDGG